MVLRAHLLAEHYLERIILLCLERGDRVIGKANLTFPQKLTLVNSFDKLEDRFVQCFRSLNTVRNQCAHELNRTITIADIDRIGIPLGKGYTKLKRDYGDNPWKLLQMTLVCICAPIAGVVSSLEDEGIQGPD